MANVEWVEPFASVNFVADAAFFEQFEREAEAAHVWQTPGYVSGIRRRAARRYFWIASACLVGWGLVLAFTPRSIRGGVFPLVMLMGLLYSISWILDWIRLLREARVPLTEQAAHQQARRASGWRAMTTYTIGTPGVRWKTQEHDVHLHWSRFYVVHELPSFVLIRGALFGVVIPKTGLASPKAVADLLAFVRGMLDEHEMGESHRIRRFLAKHSATCPCGYDLRGCDGRACPECGRPLTIGFIPNAADA